MANSKRIKVDMNHEMKWIIQQNKPISHKEFNANGGLMHQTKYVFWEIHQTLDQ